MKNYPTKLMILSALLFISFGLKTQAQTTTTVNFDTASHWTAGSGSFTSYQTDHSFSEGLFSASTTFQALREGNTLQDGFPRSNGTYGWRLRNSGTGAWTATIASGGVSTFSVNIRRWDASPNPNYTLDYSTNGGGSWTNVATINNTTLSNSSAYTTFNGTINSTNANILVRVNRVGGERIMIDDFVWTNMLIPTPVYYSKFDVFNKASATIIDWQTSLEKNCKRFNVLRSTDGNYFELLGSIATKAQFGNSDHQLNYRFIDNEPRLGVNYYRLEQLDIDNRKHQSKVLQIVWDNDGSIMSVYPNPVLDVLQVDFRSNKAARIRLRLVNIEGRVIKSQEVETNKGINRIIVNTEELSKGIYILQLSENNKLTHVRKIRKD